MSTQDEPWWHAAPAQPPVDSVMVEGMKLAAALRDWAVQSGAAAAVSDLASSAASSASAYLAQANAEPEQPVQQVVRCTDCPVCRGLDALDRTNPEMARTARAALHQVSGLLGAFLPGDGQAKG
jgi:hypothetical protein